MEITGREGPSLEVLLPFAYVSFREELIIVSYLGPGYPAARDGLSNSQLFVLLGLHPSTRLLGLWYVSSCSNLNI